MQPYSRYYPAPLLTTSTDNTAGVTQYGSAGTFYERFADLQCSGIVKSNFHDPNYWYLNRRTRSNTMSAWYTSSDGRVTNTYRGPYWNMPEGLNTWHNSELSWAESKALSDLFEKMRGSLDLSIDAFQIKKTLRIVRDLRKVVDRTVALAADVVMRRSRNLPSKALRKAEWRARLVKRLKQRYYAGKPAGIDSLKIPADLWLGYVYGVKPTLQSIYGAVAETRNHYYSVSKMYTGKCASPRVDVVNLPSYLDGSWKARVNIRSSVRVLFKVRLEIADDTPTQLARFTSLNPVSIAWELLPWSFVADWFLNVGDTLRSLESKFVYDRFFKSGFKTVSWSYEGDLMGTRLPISSGSVGGYHVCTSMDRRFERTVLGSLPYPVPIQFRPDLSSGRLLNAAALLTTFLRHKP